MDLPSHQALSEAQKKLQDTYMILNGNLVYIHEINATFISHSDGVTYTEDINSLEVFLPDIGVYEFKDKPSLILKKTAKKQWKKSYCVDVYKINNPWYDNLIEALNLIVKWKKKPTCFHIVDKQLYYLDMLIGTKQYVNLILNDKTFYQELIDLTKVDPKWQYSVKLSEKSSPIPDLIPMKV